MVKRLFKNKKFLLAALVFLIIVSVVSFFLISRDKSDQSSSSSGEQKTIQEDDSTPSATPAESPKQETPPEAKLPDLCGSVSDIVGSASKATGNTTKTNNNSQLTECNYSKEGQLVNVKVYEYASEDDAKKDLEKVQIKGYSSQNKGKYNVMTSVSTNSGINMSEANKINQALLDKL